MAFDQSSLRRFEISSCKATSRSHLPHLSYSYAHLQCARGTQKQDIRTLRILTDRGTEYYGAREHHEDKLYLAVEDIDHSRTKARYPQINGICERFHQTIQNEFYAIAFRKKVFKNVEKSGLTHYK
ncbi:hypothetical protein NEOC65_001008 [Neochlamydia sp. AcF65]|nr:hypothetical protein [Neochlamydia sp. AcF65]